jgi:gliding motility-associated-like protein
MKWRLLFGLCLSCFVTIHAQVSSYVPRKDLVAWFPLNASISDSSGFSNQLTNYNGVKFVSDRNGKGSAACHFNGVSQDLKANHSGSLSVSADLTIAAWVLDSISTSPYQTIVAKRQSAYWNYSLSISHDTSLTKKGKNKIVTSRRNTGPQVDFKFSFDTVPIGKWVHLAVTVQSDTVRFYINGKESSCLVDTNVLYPKSFGRVFSIPAKDPLSSLSVGSSNDGTEYFKGRIDEVGIWKRALSRCEIRGLVISKSWIDAKVYHNNSVYRCGIDSFTLTALPAMKSYLWSNGVSKSKNTVKKSGKYRLTITDSFGCEFRDTISVLFSNPKLSIGADSVLLKNCKRDSLRVSVGNKWTSVLWSNTKKDSFVFLKSTGYYWVKVQDTNACYANDTFYFGNAGKVDLTLVSIDSVRCNGGNTGKIVSSISGGFSPYQLKWNDPFGQTTTIVSNLAAGSYRGIFKDRFGCADTLDALVKQPNILYATVAATDSVNCFGGTDGRAFVSATGGVSPYSYKWNDPSSQTGSLVANLKAGPYSVLITDVKGCTTSASTVIGQPNKLIVSVSKIDSVFCFATNTGKIETKVIGGNGVNRFQWSDPLKQKTKDADSLSIGFYKLLVQDQYGCRDSLQVQLFGPALLKVQALSSDSAKCYNQPSGKLKVSVTGGNGGYIYQWNDFKQQKTPEASSLMVGTYKAVVGDRKGCRDSVLMSVLQPPKIVTTLVRHDSVSCFQGQDGRLEVSSIGGTGWRKFQWFDKLNQTTPIASNLSSGTYRLRVFDYYQCSDTALFFVHQPERLTLTIAWVDSVNCFNGSDGKFAVKATGGNSGYRYWWADSLMRKGFVAYGLKSKDYKVRVTDLKGCKDSVGYLVPQPAKLSVSVIRNDSVNCFQGNDGRVFVSCLGGNGGYRYVWTDSKKQNSDSAVGLVKGNYKVLVTDLYQCRDSLQVNVFEPLKVSLTIDKVDSVSCFKFSDGIISTSTLGGTGTYTYKWSTNPVQTAPIAKGLPAGKYFVWVQDNYGCSDSNSATVFEPDSITLKIIAPEYTMKGAVISLSSVETPFQPYKYNWGPSTTFTKQVNAKVPRIIIPKSGNVILTIVNSKGCPLSDTAYINVVLPPKEFMPTGFTPNADNLNEGFGLPIIFETISLRVYSRWGGLVFSSSPEASRWDGLVNGSLAPSDVYYYEFEAKLKGTDQIISHGGNVTLIR